MTMYNGKRSIKQQDGSWKSYFVGLTLFIEPDQNNPGTERIQLVDNRTGERYRFWPAQDRRPEAAPPAASAPGAAAPGAYPAAAPAPAASPPAYTPGQNPYPDPYAQGQGEDASGERRYPDDPPDERW